MTENLCLGCNSLNICRALNNEIMKTLLNVIYLFSFLSFAQPSDLGYELNGLNDCIVVPNTTYINSNNTAVSNRTIETWFKTNDATTKQVIFEEGGGTNAILIYLDSDRLYCGAYKSNGNSAEFFRSSSSDILDDTWYHVAFVISTSGGTTTFSWYLNGILQDSQNGFSIPKHTGGIEIGRNGKLRYGNCTSWAASSVTSSNSENCTNNTTGTNNTKYYFDGNMFGFRIWNSGRTSTEINNNINTELTSGTNLVANLDDDSIEYLNSSSNWTTASANGNGTAYMWSATANSSNWNHPGNWHGSNVPSTTKLQKVIIPSSTNYPSISSEIRIGKLELSSSDSEFNIEDGGTLNVYYDVTNDGTITIENNGSFILQDDEAVSGTGSFIIKRDSPDYPGDDYFSIWSTPVAEEDSELGTIFTNDILAYGYDASQNPSSYVQIGGTNNMEVGRGYFVRSDNDSGVITRTFTGLVNNGTIEEEIYHNSDTDNFNLIGNPYSSAIDWLSFYRDNSEILDGTVYLWNQSTVGANNKTIDYISLNATGSSDAETKGIIATAQGFFAKSIESGTVKFKNAHRVIENNSTFYRSSDNSNDGKSWFRLSGTMGYSPILVGFVPGATDGYESTYDAEFMNEGATIEFYSLIDDGKYDIQGRSQLQPNQYVQVPLGYQVTSGGDYTISKVLEYIDTNFEILLEDTLENTFTDLRTSDYIFNVSGPTEDNSRFIIHYNYNETLSLNDFDVVSENVTTFFSNNVLITKVGYNVSPVSVQVYDLSGKEILNTTFNENIPTQNLSSGVYIVRYITENSSSISKKVIKG